MQRLALYRTLPAFILMFMIQSCLVSGPVGIPVGPGSAPPINPPFKAYDACLLDIDPLPVWDFTKLEASQQDCFKQTIKSYNLALPPGTTAEQAFARYRDCLKKNGHVVVSVGLFAINGNNENTARQNALQ